MVHVLFSEIDEGSHRRLFEKHLDKFHATEQEKLRRYHRWQDAQLSLLGKLLVMKGAETMGVPYAGNEQLQYNEYGKPAWKQNPFFFNISHSGGIAVCAVTKNMEIGIDIEIKHPVTIDDFKSQMIPTEWKRIISAEDEMAAFYKYWTEKEAVIKACGAGLSIPLQSFEVVNSCTTVNGRPFFLREIMVNRDYVCHLATGEKLAEEQVGVVGVRM